MRDESIRDDFNEPDVLDMSDADKQTMSDEFTAGFNSPMAETGRADTPPVETNPAAAPAPTPAAPAAAAPAASPEPIEDPFAGLPPAAREAIAKVVTLDQELRSVKGRFSNLQSRLDHAERELAESRKAPAAPAPAAEPPARNAPKRELVRGELSEVADALDEAEEQIEARLLAKINEKLAPAPAPAQAPAAAPAPAVPSVDPEEAALTQAQPEWVSKMNSADFRLWLTTQPPEFQETMATASKAAVAIDALNKFDVYQGGLRAAAEAARTTAQRRNDRSKDAVTPAASRAARPANTSGALVTEEDGFLSAFNNP